MTPALPAAHDATALHALRADPLFQQCSHASLARLLPHLQLCEWTAGTPLYAAGDAANDLYLRLDGEVQRAGQPLALQRWGEEAASDLPHYLHGVQALSDARALRIPRAALASLLRWLMAGLVLAGLVAVFIGTVLGAFAGYYGRWVDDVLNWFYSVFSSIPYLLLILAVAAVLQQKGTFTIVLILFGVGTALYALGVLIQTLVEGDLRGARAALAFPVGVALVTRRERARQSVPQARPALCEQVTLDLFHGATVPLVTSVRRSWVDGPNSASEVTVSPASGSLFSSPRRSSRTSAASTRSRRR